MAQEKITLKVNRGMVILKKSKGNSYPDIKIQQIVKYEQPKSTIWKERVGLMLLSPKKEIFQITTTKKN